MDSIILTSISFMDFLFLLGFWILGLKIAGLILFKIFSELKFEDFFTFAMVTIAEIILGVFLLMKTLQNPNITFAILTILFILLINLGYLMKMMDISKKNRGKWGDFWYMVVITIFTFILYTGVVKMIYFT